MSAVLVINSGSSSFKYQVIDIATEQTLIGGVVERITDHAAGFAQMLDVCAAQGIDLATVEMVAVGHRVVQGGQRFTAPTEITDRVEREIEELAELAPLHNPGALQGIRAARRAFPTVPHVAVFDTAFHQTMPDAAAHYAIDADLAARHRIRRYGFHGTSHQYVSARAAEFLGIPRERFNAIVLHLGNGASACAVRGGLSVDTSMGMTPLEGLVMGTRSGDLDPAVLPYLQRRAGLDADALDDLLNKRSGLLGLTGSGDMRDVANRADAGDVAARLARDIVAHRITHYVGAYYAVLGRVDAVVFTAGVGENDAPLRVAALSGLQRLGIAVDAERNAARSTEPRVISPDGTEVAVLVVPTNEELEIARQSVQCLESAR